MKEEIIKMLVPGKNLFAVNSNGRVFYLEEASSSWQELQYLGVEFKRISAAKNVIWAIGGDHQVYVFVYGIEVPIRVKESYYENQRWNPLDGFCNNLLPTDRPRFSSIDGTLERSPETIHPPTMAWTWDDDWHIETLFNGHQLQMGGWTYAVDFPAEYYEKKGFTSCVRRRKWIRNRIYVAINSWSSVPGLHREMSEEPFIDVCVGGFDIAGGNENELQVWTVTVAGRVMVRQGVTQTSPEGSGWMHIPTPTGKDVSQLSVAASGLVWAVTWHGSVLVRIGVSALDPTGISWSEIGAPRPETPLSFVSIGRSIVWGVGRDGSVWFRQGFKSTDTSSSDVLIKGTKWIKMVGSVSMLSVGLEDQVFSVSTTSELTDSRLIQMRTGVSPSDISGKTWKTISAAASFQSQRFSRGRSVSESSKRLRLSSDSSGTPGSSSYEQSETASINDSGPSSRTDTQDKQEKSRLQSIGENVLSASGEAMLASAIGTVTRATVGRIPVVGPVVAGATTRAVLQEVNKLSLSASDNGDEVDGGKSVGKDDDSTIDQSMYQSALETIESEPTSGETDDRSGSETESLSTRVMLEDDEVESLSEFQWLWVSAGSCCVRSGQLPSGWFENRRPEGQQTLELEPWRQEILSGLMSNNAQTKQFSHFEDAIERSSWVKKGLIKFNLGGAGRRFEQAYLELEQCGSTGNAVDFGTLSIFSTKSNFKEHISLSEITCASICSDRSSPQLSIFTPKRSKLLLPIHIRFSNEKEMEDWHSDLVTGINSVRGTVSRPSAGSVFSVSNRGEVFVFDPSAAASSGEEENSVVGNNYSQELDVFSKPLPLCENLANGFEPGSSLYMELRLMEDCDVFSLNLVLGKVGLPGGDISLHFNPRLSNNQIVLNSFDAGAWGDEEKLPLIVMMDDGSAVRAFKQSNQVQLVVKALQEKYEIFVNGVKFAAFRYRVRPESVSHFKLGGNIEVSKVIYTSNSRIVPPQDIYWRSLGGGHLLQVESGPGGVVWGLSYDGTAWHYTGGWGGAHFKGTASSTSGINPMHDRKYFYIYENQRWNPLTGFSVHGLPTDRYMWSDKSGKYSATKESIKLPSSSWQWTGDWIVDYHTPGGVDRDGWQYATDFPATYHSSKTFTDYVRRRRWARRCQLTTTGPWRQLGNTKLIDISVQPWNSDKHSVAAWAVATNGEVLLREGVTKQCAEGTAWTHVRSDVLFQGVTVGTDGSVWLVSAEGRVFLRQGITEISPTGQVWIQLQNPDKATFFKSVSAGRSGVWAIDSSGKLWVRLGIQVQFPEGTSWAPVSDNIKSVSAGDRSDLWAVLENQHGVGGVIVRRRGISPATPSGEDWETCIGGGWKHVSIRGWTK